MKNNEKHINVVIIGCSSGLGKHLALAYGKYQNVYKKDNGGRQKEKLNLVLVARRKELLEELKGILNRSDRNIHIIPADITDDNNVQLIIKNSLNFFKKVNLGYNNKIHQIVCNAGILVKASPQDIEDDTWEKLYKTNYLSHRNIIEYAIKSNSIIENGNIAFTNSSEGKKYFPTPNNFFGAYGKSKKMLEYWIQKDLRPNYGNKYNITVMYPSKIDGPMFFHILEKDGTRTKRLPEWNILGFKEPYKKFNEYNLDNLALSLSVIEEYSSFLLF